MIRQKRGSRRERWDAKSGAKGAFPCQSVGLFFGGRMEIVDISQIRINCILWGGGAAGQPFCMFMAKSSLPASHSFYGPGRGGYNLCHKVVAFSAFPRGIQVEGMVEKINVFEGNEPSPGNGQSERQREEQSLWMFRAKF